MNETLVLVIGSVGLPAFAALIVWAFHKAGVPAEYDQTIVFVISIAFAVAVITMNFFPDTSKLIVGVVTMLYTLLTALQKVAENTVTALFGSDEKKAELRAKFSK